MNHRVPPIEGSDRLCVDRLRAANLLLDLSVKELLVKQLIVTACMHLGTPTRNELVDAVISTPYGRVKDRKGVQFQIRRLIEHHVLAVKRDD